MTISHGLGRALDLQRDRAAKAFSDVSHTSAPQ
jgi:hypothetical protein